jgi:hypothetical protein
VVVSVVVSVVVVVVVVVEVEVEVAHRLPPLQRQHAGAWATLLLRVLQPSAPCSCSARCRA